MTTPVKKKVPDPAQRVAMRERQSWAASMINHHFGAFKDSSPELWTNRTFLLIVAKVYEHLVLCKKISPKDFLELTKTLGESCKSTPRRTHGTGAKGRNSTPESNFGGVVAGLQEMVRQIYGANLQTAEAESSPNSALIKPDLDTET